MSDLEIASTAGTWVAAFLGLLALGVFLGPFLIWKTSQTERHKALDKLEKGEAENGGFISKGLRVSPTIRLFRRVRVPDLREQPQLAGWKFVWDEKAHLVSPSSGGWVQFCILLKASGVPLSLGGPLDISAGKTWLPLHRNWILMLGIAGRFAKRLDEGKIPPKVKVRANTTPGMPGLEGGRLSRDFANAAMLSRSNRRHRGAGLIDDAGDEFDPLFGTLGTLWTMRYPSNNSRHKAYYKHHTTEESGSPVSDTLGIQSLFWLAVGCLPLANGDVYSLENCILRHQAVQSGAARMANNPFGGETHLDSDSSDDSWTMDDAIRANMYSLPVQPKRQKGFKSPGDPVAFRFSLVNETAEELTKIANSLETPAGKVYSLEEMDISDTDSKQLKEYIGGEYHPISSRFVRLGKEDKEPNSGQSLPLFLARPSSQILAKSLLDLTLSPQGYLVGIAKNSWCRGTLCNAAKLLPHLLTKTCNDIKYLNVPDGSLKSDLVNLCTILLDMGLKYKPTRAFYRAIWSLDGVIHKLLPLNLKAMAAVGVVTITSAEFRGFLTSAVRMIQESKDKSVTLDLGPASYLNVPSVMGIMQKYPVDITELFPGESISIETVDIRFTHMLFAALKACLRSTVLQASLNSTPLFEAFLGMDELVYVG